MVIFISWSTSQNTTLCVYMQYMAAFWCVHHKSCDQDRDCEIEPVGIDQGNQSDNMALTWSQNSEQISSWDRIRKKTQERQTEGQQRCASGPKVWDRRHTVTVCLKQHLVKRVWVLAWLLRKRQFVSECVSQCWGKNCKYRTEDWRGYCICYIMVKTSTTRNNTVIRKWACLTVWARHSYYLN